MKKIVHLSVWCLWVCAWLSATPIIGLNVKDFGALGDGVTDDSDAIQKALWALRGMSANVLLARQPMVDDLPEFAQARALGTTSENVIQPEVFFPAGTYRVTRTLVAGSLCLRGEAGTCIKMDDPERDILYCHWGFRVRVSGMTFEGGRRQLLLYTGNNDTANFCVEKCVFRNSSGPAIWSHNYRRPGGRDFRTRTMGPYELAETPEGPVLTPNDESQPHFYHSTLAVVSNCRFEDCAAAVDMETDGEQLEDCVFTTRKIVRKPVFLGGARYINITGHAAGAEGNDACWFAGTNYNLVVCGGSFDFEANCEVPAVRWKLVRRGEIPASITVRDVRFSGLRGPVLRIANQSFENSPLLLDFDQIQVNDSTMPIPAVTWDVPFDQQRASQSRYNFQPAIKRFDGATPTLEPPFLWSITRCQGLDADGIPETLALNQSGDIDPEDTARFAVKRPPLPKVAEDARWLDARDYGVDDDPDSDDTAALQALFAAAREVDGPVQLLLPPVLMRISRTLELPRECRITVHGLGCLLQSNRELPIFHGTGVNSLGVEHLRLAWGSAAFELVASPVARVLIDKCFFYQQRKCSVAMRAGEGNAAGLTISRCTFISPVQGVDSDAATTCLENNWMSTNGRQDRQAFIVNRGRMHCWGMLGVPMPMKEHEHSFLPVVPGWPFANDLRWFDNFGQLDIRHSRFGGEYYGFVPVFQCAPGGTVAIEGGFACFGYPYCQNCIVYCEKKPSGILFRNFGWEWRRGVQRSVKTAVPELDVPVLQRNFLWRD